MFGEVRYLAEDLQNVSKLVNILEYVIIPGCQG